MQVQANKAIRNGSKIGILSLLSFFNRISFGINSLVLPLYALAIGQDEAF